MQMTCTQKQLVRGLSIVNRAVATRTTQPILTHILLEAGENGLRLVATNLEISVQCWIEADVQQAGAATVPARLLTDFVRSLPDEPVSLAYKPDTQTMHVRCARMDAKIKGMAAADFPAVPHMPDAGVPLDLEAMQPALDVELDNLSVSRMIDQVAFAASTDTFRPALSGILTQWQNGRFSLAATDGYRLCVRAMPLPSDSQAPADMQLIIPAKSFMEVAKISGESDRTQPIRLYMQDREKAQLLFGMQGLANGVQRIEVATQLINASFPSYQAIVPTTHKTRMVVPTEALHQAIRIASLFAKDNANRVQVQVSRSDDHTIGMRIVSADGEQGTTVNELEADVSGPDIDIAFNAQYLLDLLTQVLEEEIVIEASEKTRPCALYPQGQNKDDFLYVVMPMHTR